MKTIPVISDFDCFSPEDYFLQEPRPEGLPLTAIRIAVERSRAVLNGLLSCSETSKDDGFRIRHSDVVTCLWTVDGLLEQVESMINTSEEKI